MTTEKLQTKELNELYERFNFLFNEINKQTRFIESSLDKISYEPKNTECESEQEEPLSFIDKMELLNYNFLQVLSILQNNANRLNKLI